MEEVKEALEEVEWEMLAKEQFGFSAIIEMIVTSQIPMVCHNGIYDVMFMVRQFVADLPPTYAEFASLVHVHFPQLFDTKVICSEL